MTDCPADFSLTATQIRALENQDFDHSVPGAVARDFNHLLDRIGAQGIEVSPKHLLGLKYLKDFNQSLSRPQDVRLKRPMQKSYPALNGLCLLLRGSGLTYIDGTGGKCRLKPDLAVLASWRSLHPAEQYFYLLETWLTRAREESIGESSLGAGEILSKVVGFLERFEQRERLSFNTPQDTDMLRYYPGWHNLALLQSFGLVEIGVMPPAEGQGWRPTHARLTAWGKALAGSLVGALKPDQGSGRRGFLPPDRWLDPESTLKPWFAAIKRHIPAWRQGLDVPEPEYRAGAQPFKVTLSPRCWRRIALRGSDTLDMMANTLLDAFAFDQDHLYQFSYQDRHGGRIEIHHPGMEWEFGHAKADAVLIGELPLYPGMRMEFLYDFGAYWEFGIMVEDAKNAPVIDKPTLLESHGEAPAQYPDFDDADG